MKIRLIEDFNGRPAGAEFTVDDDAGDKLIGAGRAEEIKVAKTTKKKSTKKKA